MAPDEDRLLPTPGRVVDAAAGTGGLALAAAFGTVARLRAGRPLHPQGATYASTVTMSGGSSSGVAWLDEAGTHEVRVRVSRAVGLPLWMPDIYGIALRVPDAGGRPVDLLFASTGDTATGRFLLRLRRGVESGPLTTLLPVRSVNGPLLLRFVASTPTPVDELALPAALTLSWARGAGHWQDVGTLVPGPRLGRELEEEHHDPVVHELPGTSQYGVVRRLREPAYGAARAVVSRRAGGGGGRW